MLTVIAVTTVLEPLWAGPDADEVAEEIRRLVEDLEVGDSLLAAERGDDGAEDEGIEDEGTDDEATAREDGPYVVTVEDLANVYALRDFRPLWSKRDADELERFVHGVVADGLDPVHYHVEALSSAAARDDEGAAMHARRDALRTDAFVRLARDLRTGRVDPSEVMGGGEIERGEDRPLTPEVVERLIDAGDIADALDAQRPDHPVYRRLVEALEEYRAFAEGDDWPQVPAGAPLAIDSTSERVPVLRARLAREGYLARDTDTTSAVFDDEVDTAVRRFQHTHGLNDDGIVSKSTLRELNHAPEHRIEQLRANLERARWVLRDMPDTYLSVNIAAQRVYKIQNDSVIWETRAVVGDAYTRTPVFSAPMREVVFNPDWTVPESINEEILEHVHDDESYLESQGFEILDDHGELVDPDDIDFSDYTGEDFPYTFRQRPGPLNPLGRVKFMFPNEFNVYLHDTPSKELFRREERTFSHGCIRVENPFELVAHLLPDSTPEAIDAIMASDDPHPVALEDPLPVLLLYWTAAADEHGEVHFHRDIYERDPDLLAALDRSPG